MSNDPYTPVSTNQTTTGPSTFTTWQQNVNKSPICQHDLISSTALIRKGINLVALQEPAINNFGVTITSKNWIPIYLSNHGSKPHKTHSLFLIRCNILTEKWNR